MAFGFLMRNDWPIKSSTKSTSEPFIISSETGSITTVAPSRVVDEIVFGAGPVDVVGYIGSPSSRRP